MSMWKRVPKSLNLYKETVTINEAPAIKRGLLKSVIYKSANLIVIVVLASPILATFGDVVLVEREVDLSGWSYEQVEAKIKDVQDRTPNCPCEYSGIPTRRMAKYNLTLDSYTQFVQSILAMCRDAQIDSSWNLSVFLDDPKEQEGCVQKWLPVYGPLNNLIASSESMAFALLQDLLDTIVTSPQFLTDDDLVRTEQEFTNRFIKGSADRVMSLVNFTSMWAATNRFVTSSEASSSALTSNSMRIPVTSLPADFQPNSTCKDNSTFLDGHGNPCRNWKGYNCDTAVETYQYTQAEVDDLLKGCPVTCGKCPKQARAVDDLGTPCRGVFHNMTSPERVNIPMIEQMVGVNTIGCLQTGEVWLHGVVREHCFNGGWRTLSTMAQWRDNVMKKWENRTPTAVELHELFHYACTEFDKQMLLPFRAATGEFVNDDGSVGVCFNETGGVYEWITCKVTRHVAALAKKHLSGAAFTSPLDALRQGFLNVSSSRIAIDRSKYHAECNAKTLKWIEKEEKSASKVLAEILGVIGGASVVVKIIMAFVEPVIDMAIKDQPAQPTSAEAEAHPTSIKVEEPLGKTRHL